MQFDHPTLTAVIAVIWRLSQGGRTIYGLHKIFCGNIKFLSEKSYFVSEKA
jgi:hypothetical protein